MKDMGEFMQNLVYGDTAIRVEVKEGRGRSVVANKQLEVGDVILEERAVAWGPKQLSPCCCLACCAPLAYTHISWCTRCGLPLCNQNCPMIAKHNPECELMSHAKHMLILNSERDVQQEKRQNELTCVRWARGFMPSLVLIRAAVAHYTRSA